MRLSPFYSIFYDSAGAYTLVNSQKDCIHFWFQTSLIQTYSPTYSLTHSLTHSLTLSSQLKQ